MQAQPQHQPTQPTQPTTATPLTANSWSAPREVMVMESDGLGGVREVPRMLSAIDRLYGRFASMYMHKWSSHFTSPQLIADWKKAWSNALIAEGITPRLALEGVERCRTEYPTWPPSEGQFIALCKPPMDYELAFRDAVRELRKRLLNDPDKQPHWPIPALYWATVDFGQGAMIEAIYGQVAARWKKLLDKRLQGDCPDVPKYVPQLAAPVRNAEGEAITSAQAKADALAAMRSMAHRRPSQDVAITKAREVLARHEAGEPVAAYLLAHARERLARLTGATTAPADDEPI
jgi:hypothetical protein